MADHLEKRGTNYLAFLTIPADVRPIFGKLRFVQSTQTSNKAEAKLRAAILVAGWKEEIKKARGTIPSAKDDYWAALRKNYAQAQEAGDDGLQWAIQDIAKEATSAMADREKAGALYKMATNQATPLGPLVTAWKESLRLAQKTIDQQHRDMLKVAGHFNILEALQPQAIKEWTDQLMKDGATASTIERLGNACRSFWKYLRRSAAVPMTAPDPFVGPFQLAQGMAPRTDTGRSGSSYAPEQLADLYARALAKGDQPLANLIALGAYSGARIEEICQLTKETTKNGVFKIPDSKTAAGIREIPIHPDVAPLVKKMLEETTDEFLVPSTDGGKYETRSASVGKRFGRLKTAAKFGPSHVFHSTRNTLITMMQRAGVPEGIAADVVGHEKQTITYGLYGSGSAHEQKLAALSTVKYPAPLDKP